MDSPFLRGEGPQVLGHICHAGNPLEQSSVWMFTNCQWIREFLDKAEDIPGFTPIYLGVSSVLEHDVVISQ